jgi:hypothetical protein
MHNMQLDRQSHCLSLKHRKVIIGGFMMVITASLRHELEASGFLHGGSNPA